jgi:hypothetical protein
MDGLREQVRGVSGSVQNRPTERERRDPSRIQWRKDFEGTLSELRERTSPAFPELGTRRWRLVDVIGEATYERGGSDLQARGLPFVAAPWQAAIFIFDKTGRHALPSGV